MPDAAYVDHLADQLTTRRPDVLRAAEDELQAIRAFKATVARFINNPNIALDIRQDLAADLHLPIPAA